MKKQIDKQIVSCLNSHNMSNENLVKNIKQELAKKLQLTTSPNIRFFSNSWVILKHENKFLFVNRFEWKIFVLNYNYIGEEINWIARVRDYKKNWWYVDSSMKEIITPKYQFVGPFIKGLWRVKNWKYGFIDINENIIIPFEYEDASDFTMHEDSFAKLTKHWIQKTIYKANLL